MKTMIEFAEEMASTLRVVLQADVEVIHNDDKIEVRSSVNVSGVNYKQRFDVTGGMLQDECHDFREFIIRSEVSRLAISMAYSHLSRDKGDDNE